jgi:hypothetical protein
VLFRDTIDEKAVADYENCGTVNSNNILMMEK